MNQRTFGNALLLILSTLFTLGLLEVVIGKVFIIQAPIKFHFALPDGLAILAQSSKAGRLPNNYVAIVGDSYAHGKGDWLLQADVNSNGPYHSTHVLQQLTDKDVISFGQSGSSNIRGWSREPGARFRFISAAIVSDIKQPELILAYFYAGNDLMENVTDVRREFLPEYGEQGLHSDVVWDQFFDAQIEGRKVGPYRGIDSTLGWLPLAVLRVIVYELRTKKLGDELGDIQLMQAGSTNLARVNGQLTALPDALQSPSMELDQSETELGFLVTEQSLRDLKRRFQQSQIVVIYIPSVLGSYEIVSTRVSVEDRFTTTEKGAVEEAIFPSALLTQRSDEVSSRLQAIARKLEVPFIDTRPQLRAAARQQIIHGPKDWLHFNRIGYEVLANAIACGVADLQIWPANVCTDK